MDQSISDFLNTRLSLRRSLINVLSGGGVHANWQKIASYLSSLGWQNRINASFIGEISAYNPNNYASQAESFLSQIGQWTGVTVRILLLALRGCHLDVIASDIEREAGGQSSYVVTGAPISISNYAIYSGGAPAISPISAQDTPLVASPPNAYTAGELLAKEKSTVRKRLLEAGQDATFFVAKIRLTDEIADGKVLPLNVIFCKNEKDAKEEADLKWDRDLEAYDGKEDKVPHGYVVGSFCSWHGAGERKVKNVGVSLASKSAK